MRGSFRRVASDAYKVSMKRLFAFLFSAAFGVAMIFFALQVPAHLRAVDEIVLQTAGPGTPSLVDEGLSLVKKDQLGAADLFAEAAQSAHIANSGKLSAAADDLAARHPAYKILGGPVDWALENLL